MSLSSLVWRSNGALLGVTLAILMLCRSADAQTPAAVAAHDEAAHDEAAHDEAAHDEAAPHEAGHDEGAGAAMAARVATSIGSIDEAMHAEQRDAGLWGLGIWTVLGLVTAFGLARSRRLGP